jgi:hypothetical protein
LLTASGRSKVAGLPNGHAVDGASPSSSSAGSQTLETQLSRLETVGEKVKLVMWLVLAIRERVSSPNGCGDVCAGLCTWSDCRVVRSLAPASYAAAIQVLRYYGAFAAMLEVHQSCPVCGHLLTSVRFEKVLNFLLASANTRDMLYLISDTVRTHLDVWTAMDALASLASAVGQAHERLRTRSIWVRPAMSLLKRLDEAEKLDTRTKTQMQMDYASLHQVRCLSI